MTLEGKRTMVSLGMFAWVPAIVPGIVWNLQGSAWYGWIVVLMIPLAAISSILALVLAATARCPACERRYFAFMLPFFVFKRACQRCGYRDAKGSA